MNSEGKESTEDIKPGIRLRLNITKSGSKAAPLTSTASPDIANLMQMVQSLTQSTAPVGKCMDHVQADLSLMMKERENWRSEFRRNVDSLAASRERTRETLEPLQSKLASLDEMVEKKINEIEGLKMKISHNDSWIRKHLTSAALS